MSVDVIAKSDDKSGGKKEKMRKEEAARLGLTTDELKKQRKKASKSHKATREAELLQKEAQSNDHVQEQTRMTSWSSENRRTGTNESSVSSKRRKDEDTANEEEVDTSSKRRRTRSMDAAEEKALIKDAEQILSPDQWRLENSITIRKGSDRSYAPPAPYQRFSDAPFNAGIQKALISAGFDKPTAIQAQSWPIALSGKIDFPTHFAPVHFNDQITYIFVYEKKKKKHEKRLTKKTFF